MGESSRCKAKSPHRVLSEQMSWQGEVSLQQPVPSLFNLGFVQMIVLCLVRGFLPSLMCLLFLPPPPHHPIDVSPRPAAPMTLLLTEGNGGSLPWHSRPSTVEAQAHSSASSQLPPSLCPLTSVPSFPRLVLAPAVSSVQESVPLIGVPLPQDPTPPVGPCSTNGGCIVGQEHGFGLD